MRPCIQDPLEALDLERDANPQATPASVRAIHGTEWVLALYPHPESQHELASFDFLTPERPPRASR